MAKRGHLLNATGMSFVLLVSSCLWGVTLHADTPGESLYKAKCGTCHGADGKGETPVGKMYKLRDLGSADVQKQSDDDLTSIISKGKNKMPGYGRSLKEEQIKDLVAYVRAFAKK